jgi:hypothetical protein
VAAQAQAALRAMVPACMAAAESDRVRSRWAVQWPPQVALACALALWTGQAEAAMAKGSRALVMLAEE